MMNRRQKLLDDLLLVFFAVFIFGSTFSIALAQIALGVSLVLFLVVAFATRYNPFTRSLRWFYAFIGLYILWMLLASLLGETPLRSVRILKEEWLFCIVPVAIYLLSKENYRRTLFSVFAVGVAVFSAYGILQFFTGVHWFKTALPDPGPEFGYIVRGTFPSPMTFGNYFGVAGAVLAGLIIAGWSNLKVGTRTLYGITSLLAIIATIGSYNRGAILGLIVAGVILCVWLRTWKVLTAIVIVVLIGVVTILAVPGLHDRLESNLAREYDLNNKVGRFYLWQRTVKIIEAHPVLGVGQGNFQDAYRKYLPEDINERLVYVHAHNDFLNIGALSGLPGLLFFAGIWIALFCYLRRAREKGYPSPHGRGSCAADVLVCPNQLLSAALAGSVVFLTTSMTEATFADEEVRQMLMFVWALGLFGLFPRKIQP